jgi:hypothetical protein
MAAPTGKHHGMACRLTAGASVSLPKSKYIIKKESFFL